MKDNTFESDRKRTPGVEALSYSRSLHTRQQAVHVSRGKMMMLTDEVMLEEKMTRMHTIRSTA